jgi:SAM-dependent methyltransferase
MTADRAAYDDIGSGYDLTRRADPYIVSRFEARLQPRPDGDYLDVGCGTGNYTVALAQRVGHWYAVDESLAMLTAAAAKSNTVQWVIASAERLPIASSRISGVLCTLALHHFRDLTTACAEMRRVLGDGRLVIFTASHAQMRGYWLNEYFPDARARSIAKMPDVDVILESLRKAGFRTIEQELYSVRPDLQDGFLYSARWHPERYLSERFRAGISTFRTLTTEAELEQGRAQLSRDIASGRIEQTVAKYARESADYLFLSAT